MSWMRSYLFLYQYITRITINNGTPHLKHQRTKTTWDGIQQNYCGAGGLQQVCGRPTLALISALVPQTLSCSVCVEDSRLINALSSKLYLFNPIILEGRRDTTDDFVTIPFQLILFSAALVELAKSILVHSLILSSHLFFCLPLFLCPFTVPCRSVFAKPEDLETWPNHLSFRFLTRIRSSSYSPIDAVKVHDSQTYTNMEMGAHQLHLRSKRYVVVSLNGLPLCKSCSGLCNT